MNNPRVMEFDGSHLMQQANAFRVETASSLDRFADIWPTTRRQAGAACYPFQCADVVQIWLDTIGRARGVEPVFVCVRNSAGEPFMLLPLGIEISASVRILGFLDCGVSDYNAPVLFPRAMPASLDAKTLWQEIEHALPQFDVACLEKMPARMGDYANPLAGIATSDHPESCHIVSLTGPADDFEAEYLPNARDSNRRLRKLKSRGDVRFEIAETEEDRNRIFEALIRMKRQRFNDTSARDLFVDAGCFDFYAEATRILGPKGNAIVTALTVDDEIVAADWGLATDRQFYDLLPSYQTGEWRAFAPGRLLTEWMMKSLLERGFRQFDYGIGDEPYKFDYCDVHVLLKDAYVAATAKGTAYLQALKLRQAARHSLRDTRVGTAIKAARNFMRRCVRRKPLQTINAAPAWLAVLTVASLAIDA